MYLYIVNFDRYKDLIKIGISKSFKKRFIDLKRIYGPISQVKIYEGKMYRYAEQILHYRLREHNVRLEFDGGSEFFQFQYDDSFFDEILSPCDMKRIEYNLLDRTQEKPLVKAKEEVELENKGFKHWPEFIHHVRDNGDLLHVMGLIFDLRDTNSTTSPFDHKEYTSQFHREIKILCDRLGVTINLDTLNTKEFVIYDFGEKFLNLQKNLSKNDFMTAINRFIQSLDYSKELELLRQNENKLNRFYTLEDIKKEYFI